MITKDEAGKIKNNCRSINLISQHKSITQLFLMTFLLKSIFN